MTATFVRRKLTRIVTVATLAASASSIALAAEDYPHAFPRAGVMQLFDNERVTAWEVRWLKDVPQPIHRHRYDMAGALVLS